MYSLTTSENVLFLRLPTAKTSLINPKTMDLSRKNGFFFLVRTNGGDDRGGGDCGRVSSPETVANKSRGEVGRRECK